MKSRGLLIKRMMDVILALIILILTSPILLITAILIRLKLGSPVLFSQVRPGYMGKPFRLYKFRSMKDALDKKGNPLPDEERMTEFGSLLRKLSIDELPELYNILRGEMSFVGPRPLLMEYLDVYSEAEHKRHTMLPGLTGWAQINGRNAITWKKKFELDLYYINHWSLGLDVKIFFMTLIKVLKRSDISQEGQVTVEKYNGMN